MATATQVKRDPLGLPFSSAVVIPPSKETHGNTGTYAGSLYDLLHRFGRNWQIAAGVISAESSNKVMSHSRNPDGGENRGLFQIDTNTAAAHGLDPNKLYIPSYNAYAAWVISKGGKDWHAWATAYGNPKDPSTYMSSDAPAVKASHGASAKLPNADSAGPLGIPIDTSTANPLAKGGDLNPGDWTGALGTFLGHLVDPGWWLRVGKIVGGGICLILGLYLFSQQFAAGRAAKRVTKVAALA